jgi:diaminopimelate decarboxylase
VVKQTTSTVFAGIDSGFNHLIDQCFMVRNIILKTSLIRKERAFYSVVGYICETDTFANNRRISEIKEGDILSFKMQVPIAILCHLITTQDTGQLKYYG